MIIGMQELRTRDARPSVASATVPGETVQWRQLSTVSSLSALITIVAWTALVMQLPQAWEDKWWVMWVPGLNPLQLFLHAYAQRLARETDQMLAQLTKTKYNFKRA
eukprot:TRINITY_DN2192_c0_g1_i1.p1 TRINITY_DN2192_c0_g1~~TRINITY_DN2192_c0_g1_i1.p1  ORF type:complete len:106 (+),score=7.17 TRINITY_DN2192_c0_g1_i1:398-715(+)